MFLDDLGKPPDPNELPVFLSMSDIAGEPDENGQSKLSRMAALIRHQRLPKPALQ